MKQLRKLVALFLVFTLTAGLSMTALAAESEPGIPENATRHTIEITLEPGETLEGSEEGISPYLWGSGTYNPGAGGATYTPQFGVTERYFAFECSALTTSGTTCAGTYTVLFVRSPSNTIAGSQNNVDGVTYKLDWITIPDTSATDYQFKIVNSTAYTLSVSIVYYSWT